MSTLAKDQEIEVNVASLSHGGSGVARYNDFVIFTPYTAPGDLARVRIKSLKKNYAEAELVSIVTPAPSRVTPPCPVFGQCGGCQWQHVDYEEQIKQKQNIVEHNLSRIAREETVTINRVVPSPAPFNYRNRAQFRAIGPKVGFYQRGTHELVEFHDCKILELALNEELLKIKGEKKNLVAEVIADAPATGVQQKGLTAIAASAAKANEGKPNERGRARRAKFDDDIDPDAEPLATKPEFRTEKIEVYMTPAGHAHRSLNKSHGEELGFSQINTAQNENMQKYICEMAGKTGRVDTDNIGGAGNLLDLYCGNGNFSFPLAKAGWRVYGVDMNRQAIFAGRKESNSKTYFAIGDCSYEVKKLAQEGRKFDTILIDPPRIGADEHLWKHLVQLGAKKLIYVSCNPATFARDWARIKNAAPYKLKSVQPFDMFPQTFHVELVALAELE